MAYLFVAYWKTQHMIVTVFLNLTERVGLRNIVSRYSDLAALAWGESKQLQLQT